MSDLTQEQKDTLKAEVGKLKHTDDAHWNAKGLPNISYLKSTEAINFNLTTEQLKAVCPDAKREGLGSNSEDEKPQSQSPAFKFKGRYPEDEEADKTEVKIFGLNFEKGQFTSIEDEALVAKLRGNPHFEEEK